VGFHPVGLKRGIAEVLDNGACGPSFDKGGSVLESAGQYSRKSWALSGRPGKGRKVNHTHDWPVGLVQSLHASSLTPARLATSGE
jgi:hypothetical protein